jgi:lysine-specific histone demethylase 1
MFGHVQQDPQQRGLFYLFYTYDGISGGAVLAGLVAGQAAVALEQQKDGDLVQGVLRLLRGIFEPQGVQVPPPLAVRGGSGAGGWEAKHLRALPNCRWQLTA